MEIALGSEQLLAANEKLKILREQARQARVASLVNNVCPGRELTNPGLLPTIAVVDCPANDRPPPPLGTAVAGGTHQARMTAVPPLSSNQSTIEQSMIQPVVQGTAVSWAMRNAMRQLQARRGTAVSPTPPADPGDKPLRCDVAIEPIDTHPPALTLTAVFDHAANTAVYPAVAVAFLANDLVPVGRVFHLLKHYDATNNSSAGYMSIETVYSLASDMGIGKRRLRMILAEGDGRAWDRYKIGRHVCLRLFSPWMVCQALEATYSRRRVYLPLGAFFEATRRGQKVTAVKHTATHFYACVHHLTGKSGIISRETLERLTGVNEETQRHYEYLLRVQSERNYRSTYEAVDQDRMWEYAGRRNLSIFVYHDYSKRTRARKPDGERTLVVSLPNSYQRPFDTASKGRRAIRPNLATKSRQGTQPDTTFYLNANAATKKAARQPRHDVLTRGDKVRRVRLWPCLFSISQ